MLNLIFLGAPGSGKGTQSSILSNELSIPAISTGDILRSEVVNKSKIGILAKKYMDSGDLVPDQVVIDIIKNRIIKEDCNNGFILDGFPRTASQAVALDKNLIELDKSISGVIDIDVPDEIIIKRISGRFSCAKCSKLYNKFFNHTKEEGVCDSCGSLEFITRDDDNETSVLNRLKSYHGKTKELIDFYAKKDLIYKVDGLKPIDLIKKDIREIVNSLSSVEVVNNY